MRKLFVLAAVGVALAAAINSVYAMNPEKFAEYFDTVARVAQRFWDGMVDNPVPVYVALGTFLLTIVYHKAKGKSLRESVEVAATRVTVVSVPAPVDGANENAVVKRARARATRTQLIADQIALENRIRKLPDLVKKAEQEVCYTEQALADVERSLEIKRKAHEEAVDKLDALKTESSAGEAELNAISAELQRLAEVV